MAKSRRAAREASQTKGGVVFGPRNYTWLTVGVLCIVFGFTAMRIENEIRGIISLYIAPVVILAGFAIVAWSILIKDDGKSATGTTATPD